MQFQLLWFIVYFLTKNMLDEELVNLIKNDSEQAYKELYLRWASRLYRFVYQYVKSESITDDIVQETFLKIWQNRDTLETNTSFKSYIFTIAYHSLLKELKRQVNNPLMEDYVEYQDRMMTSGDEIPKELDYDEFIKALAKAKHILSPRQREIFELSKEYGMSVAEISDKLSITEQVVRNQLSAALKVLRVELASFHLLFLYFIL